MATHTFGTVSMSEQSFCINEGKLYSLSEQIKALLVEKSEKKWYEVVSQHIDEPLAYLYFILAQLDERVKSDYYTNYLNSICVFPLSEAAFAMSIVDKYGRYNIYVSDQFYTLFKSALKITDVNLKREVLERLIAFSTYALVHEVNHLTYNNDVFVKLYDELLEFAEKIRDSVLEDAVKKFGPKEDFPKNLLILVEGLTNESSYLWYASGRKYKPGVNVFGKRDLEISPLPGVIWLFYRKDLEDALAYFSDLPNLLNQSGIPLDPQIHNMLKGYFTLDKEKIECIQDWIESAIDMNRYGKYIEKVINGDFLAIYDIPRFFFSISVDWTTLLVNYNIIRRLLRALTLKEFVEKFGRDKAKEILGVTDDQLDEMLKNKGDVVVYEEIEVTTEIKGKNKSCKTTNKYERITVPVCTGTANNIGGTAPPTPREKESSKGRRSRTPGRAEEGEEEPVKPPGRGHFENVFDFTLPEVEVEFDLPPEIKRIFDRPYRPKFKQR